VGVWKNIRKGWDSFSSFTRFVVGDGNNISFWHDLWCGDTALKVTFPALFGIALVNDDSVANNLEFLSYSNQWNVSFTREAPDWEVDFLLPFSRHCIQLKCVEVAKTRCGGFPPKKVYSMSSPFTPCLAQEVVAFPGKMFGALKLLQGRPFLCGQQLLARSLPWIIS
jgi:hypothetical protein